MTPEEKDMQDIEEIQMRCSKSIRECIEKFGIELTCLVLAKLANDLWFQWQKLYKNSESPTNVCEGNDDFKMSNSDSSDIVNQ